MTDQQSKIEKQRRLVAAMKDLRVVSPNLADIVRARPDMRRDIRRRLAGMTSESVAEVGFSADELDAIGAITDDEREAVRSEARLPDDEAMAALRARYAKAVAEGAASADALEIAKVEGEVARKELSVAVRRLFQKWRKAGRPTATNVTAQLRDSLQRCRELGVGSPVELTPVEKRLLGVRDG